jgi:hypothetical protein
MNPDVTWLCILPLPVSAVPGRCGKDEPRSVESFDSSVLAEVALLDIFIAGLQELAADDELGVLIT